MRDLLILVWALAAGILLAYSESPGGLFLALSIVVLLCLCTGKVKKDSWFLIPAGLVVGLGTSWIYNQLDSIDNKYYVNAIFVERQGIQDVFHINNRLIVVDEYAGSSWSKPYEGELLRGELVRLSGQFRKVPYDLSGQLLHGREIRVERLPGQTRLLSLLDAEKIRLAERLKDDLGTEAGSLAGSLVLGVKDGSLRSRQDLLKYLGIIHILSISGFHVNLLEGLLKRSGLKRISLGIILAYAVLINSVPAWRAALMKLSGTLARASRRDSSGGSQLLFAAFFQLLMAPYLLFSLSFQLTYAATMGIVFFRRPLLDLLFFVPDLRVKDGLVLSTSAMIPCIPFLSGLQSDINLALFPANLLIVPFYSFFCILSFLAIPLLMLRISPAVETLRLFMELLLHIIRFLEFLVHEFLTVRVSWTGASGVYLFASLILIVRYYGVSVKRGAAVITLGGFVLFNGYYLPGTTRITFVKSMGQAKVVIEKNLRQYEFVSEKMDKRAVRLTATPVRSPVRVAETLLMPDEGDFPRVIKDGVRIEPSGDASSDIMDEEYLFIFGKLIRLK